MYIKVVFYVIISALSAFSLTENAYADQAAQSAKIDVVLTVSGLSAETADQQGSVTFSMDMLRALPAQSFTTSTIWTEGPHDFVGVSLSALLASLPPSEMPASHLNAIAENDYAVAMPLPKADDPYPIIAYEMDQAAMSLRNKGPLWIVYPYDSDRKYQTETTYSQSVWQLVKIELTH
jgi:hypothetical protein